MGAKSILQGMMIKLALGPGQAKNYGGENITIDLKITGFNHAESSDVRVQRVNIVARNERDADFKLSRHFSPLRLIESPQQSPSAKGTIDTNGAVDVRMIAAD
jgi:hypothetical protein